MTAYIIDTETTGWEGVDNEVIELAIIKPESRFPAGLQQTRGICEPYDAIFYGRFKPRGRISFKAMSIHHILPQELVAESPSVLAKGYLPTDLQYMIGHNVDYDWEALGKPPCKRICTLAISREIWPGNDGHSLGCLGYHLSTDLAVMREALQQAHSASADCELTFGVLRAQLEQPALAHVASWEDLYQFSEEARIPKIWPFGKFEGKTIREADNGYLFWCLRQAEMDPYVHVACRRALDGK